MPVDVGEENIRVRVRDPGLFVESSFRTITISEDQGIKAVIGKLKSDPNGSTVVQSYIFDKSKWTPAEAEKWVKDHKHSARTIERRYAEIEMRVNYDTGSPKIQGYAAVFGQRAEIWPGFYEQVAPGAFADTIAKDDVRALWNHNPDYLLGRTTSKTLRLWEDGKGLGYEIIPPSTTWASDLITLIKRGDLSQSSFGFNIIKQSRETDEKEQTVTRTLERVKLFDVSPVTFPAYPQTEVHVRRIQLDNECLYFFEDVEEVITIARREEQEIPSEDPFGQRLEALKERLGGVYSK